MQSSQAPTVAGPHEESTAAIAHQHYENQYHRKNYFQIIYVSLNSVASLRAAEGFLILWGIGIISLAINERGSLS